MNDDQHTTALHEQVEREPDQRERDETPRERETSALARHRDPSLTQAPRRRRRSNGGRGVGAPDRPHGLSLGPDRWAGHRLPGRARPPLPPCSRPGIPGDAHRGTHGCPVRERACPEAAARDGVRPRSGEHYSWVSRSGIGLG